MSDKQQLNESPLVLALMGALVGMGLSREKAKKAAKTAVAKSNQKSSGKTYSDVMKQGSRGEGVKQMQQNLGMRQADGIFGPATAKAVKTFQQSQGLKVDGIVGPETKARIEKLASDNRDGSQPAPTAAPSQSSRPKARPDNTQPNFPESVNEAISFEVEDLVRLMQLAGADGAKAVDAGDINPGPAPCKVCGKVHGSDKDVAGPSITGPGPRIGGPDSASMSDTIKMISKEEEDVDGDFQDASTEPDEDYMNDVKASIPSGNDLHKEKGSYSATAGGDNPMNTEGLEETLKEKLAKALAEKKS